VLTRLRCGNSELRVNTGRWEQLAAEERVCELCGESAETERHFLLDCSFYTERRAGLLVALDGLVQEYQARDEAAVAFSVFELSADEQFALLIGGTVGRPALSQSPLMRRVQGVIMAELAEWMAMRAERLEWIAEAMAAMESRREE